MYFCRSLLIHGYSNFCLEIIEYCGIKDLAERENYYINLLKPEYNLLKVAYSRQGFRHSEEAKWKMSVAGLGRKHTEEQKFNNSNSQPNRIEIEIYDLELKTKNLYGSIRLAAKALNVFHNNMLDYLKGSQKNPFKGRYIIKKYPVMQS